jgi:hypothetical protein
MQGSNLQAVNPRERRNALIFAFHARGLFLDHRDPDEDEALDLGGEKVKSNPQAQTCISLPQDHHSETW